LLLDQFVGFDSYWKLVEREEAVQVVDGQAGSERSEIVVRVDLHIDQLSLSDSSLGGWADANKTSKRMYGEHWSGRTHLPNPVDGVRPDAEIQAPGAQPLGVVLPGHVRRLRLHEPGDAFLRRDGELMLGSQESWPMPETPARPRV